MLAAGRAEDTDWRQIAVLYGELGRPQPTPIVALNRAVAIAMAGAPEDGLRLLEEPALASELGEYHVYHAARADLLRRAGHKAEAAEAYQRALALTTNSVERAYLDRRLSQVT
jgi:RNA polymerase sigma-70 factor (ECF subfamily)